jgi:hypothetical protein
MSKRGLKQAKAYRNRIARYHRAQARNETRDDLKPTMDDILRKVLPADHPEVQRMNDKDG